MTAYFDTAAAGAVHTQLNALAAMFNGGTLVIYDASGTGGAAPIDPDVGEGTNVLLATFTFAATAFSLAAASGTFPSKTMVATASFVASTVTAAATGTASSFVLKDSGGVVRATGSVGTSGADINFSSVAFSSGANITLSSFTLTLPE